MKFAFATLLAATASVATAIPFASRPRTLQPRQACDHSPTSRDCWGDFSIDTDWYETWPDTGVTREYWLSVENITLAADGYTRQVVCFNGTIPGPLIEADWGDNLIIHVTNNMENNGTAIHWHGIRQLNSLEYDGVPGVTQCPIAPGDTLTYRFQATQYGSTWYHSHFITQYADGMAGPMIIHGPATANYDVDLGMLFLSDWSHTPTWQLWEEARLGTPPTLETGLINGTNTWDCTDSTDANCIGGGVKYETTFEAGQRYRFRLINSAVDGVFQFSIDNHTLEVVGIDLVPIVPWTTDSIVVQMGQRYDVIVEASQASGDFWLRGGWVSACAVNENPDEITGIIRYDATSTSDPTSTSGVEVGTDCGDPPLASLVPYLAMDVESVTSTGLAYEEVGFAFNEWFTWTINTTTLVVDWENPTTLQIFNNETVFPTEYNVLQVEITDADPTWAVYVIQDLSGIGLSHPIHMHGHDFWVIAQDTGMFDINTTPLTLTNPPRRDVATLPGNGYLAMAYKKDNPGSWLLHCHIAWHASQGLSMQFVESQADIAVEMTDVDVFTQTCNNWVTFEETNLYEQDDSGI